MNIWHNLLWSQGLLLMIISLGHLGKLAHSKTDDRIFIIPRYVIVIFLVGLSLYLISFIFPHPAVI